MPDAYGTWALEIHGRPGWFVPRFAGMFKPNTDPELIQRQLWRGLEVNGYGPLETDETLRLYKPEPWKPCPTGNCRAR